MDPTIWVMMVTMTEASLHRTAGDKPAHPEEGMPPTAEITDFDEAWFNSPPRPKSPADLRSKSRK